MKKEMKKILSRVVCSGLLFFTSLILLIGQGLAWFSSSTRVTATGKISVAGFGISEILCSFYRYDGVRYDLDGGIYDDAGAELKDEAFEMPEYDTIITEKNAYNNVVMRVALTLDSADGKRVAVEAEALSGTTFGKTVSTGTSGALSGYLSDVVKISVMDGFTPAAGAKNSEIYWAATAAFASAPSVPDSRNQFVTLTSAGETVTAEKVAAIQVGAAEAAAGKNTLVLWINLEYEESLVREFCAVTGLNYGELTSSAIGSTIPLSADLRFTFYAAAGDHGAQNSDVL